MAGAFTTTYGIYFLTDQLGVDDVELPGLVTATGLVGLATAVLGAVIGSWASDRFGIRKKLVFCSSLVVSAGAVVISLAPGVGVYFLGMAVTGLATEILMPVDGALVIDVLPGEGAETGKYMAVSGLADSIPRSVGPMLAPMVVAVGGLTPLGGYPALYLAGAGLAIVGGLLVRRINGSW